MKRKLIRGAQVVLPEECIETNVLIEGTKIAAIDASPNASADEIIDAAVWSCSRGWLMTRSTFANQD